MFSAVSDIMWSFILYIRLTPSHSYVLSQQDFAENKKTPTIYKKLGCTKTRPQEIKNISLLLTFFVSLYHLGFQNPSPVRSIISLPRYLTYQKTSFAGNYALKWLVFPLAISVIQTLICIISRNGRMEWVCEKQPRHRAPLPPPPTPQPSFPHPPPLLKMSWVSRFRGLPKSRLESREMDFKNCFCSTTTTLSSPVSFLFSVLLCSLHTCHFSWCPFCSLCHMPWCPHSALYHLSWCPLGPFYYVCWARSSIVHFT